MDEVPSGISSRSLERGTKETVVGGHVHDLDRAGPRDPIEKGKKGTSYKHHGAANGRVRCKDLAVDDVDGFISHIENISIQSSMPTMPPSVPSLPPSPTV